MSKLTPEVLQLYKQPLKVQGWDLALLEVSSSLRLVFMWQLLSGSRKYTAFCWTSVFLTELQFSSRHSHCEPVLSDAARHVALLLQS